MICAKFKTARTARTVKISKIFNMKSITSKLARKYIHLLKIVNKYILIAGIKFIRLLKQFDVLRYNFIFN
jgi:hypothetical protein